MSIKEIIVAFGTLAGRACRTLVKNTLWQKIESIAKPGQSHSAQPLVPAPDKIIEDVISQSIAAFPAAATSIQEPDATDDVTDHPADKACSPEPVQVIHTASLSVLAEEIEDENLRELIKDRLVGIDEADNMEKQALYAADLLAEINSFIISYNDHTQEQLEQLCQATRLELEEHNCELLDSDTWDPETQRAVKISYDLPAENTPVIIRKLSLGLKINNRLIRKQEVSLRKSKI